MSQLPQDDTSSMSDDVFEDQETTDRRIAEARRRQHEQNPFYSKDMIDDDGMPSTSTGAASAGNYMGASTSYGITHGHGQGQGYGHGHSHSRISPSGYPGYRPAREALQMYAFGDGTYRLNTAHDDDYDDGWRSYRYEEVGMNAYQQQQQQHHHQQPFDDTVNHKTILLGDSGVGKTSFLVKYNTGEFRLGSFSATVGIALTNKVVIVDGTRVKLQIWDTAGQERFRSVTHAYYRDAHALLLLYDVTNKVTFDNIRAWLAEIRDYAQDNVVILLIGNKADCSNSDRQVKREDGERLSREHNVPFMETSAKTGQNVELAFAAIARQLKCRGSGFGDSERFNVHDFVRDNTKAQSACVQCKYQ